MFYRINKKQEYFSIIKIIDKLNKKMTKKKE